MDFDQFRIQGTDGLGLVLADGVNLMVGGLKCDELVFKQQDVVLGVNQMSNNLIPFILKNCCLVIESADLLH